MIYGKVGRLGHGKTMRAVVDALALRELRGRNRECWLASNVTIATPPGVRFLLLPMDGFSESLGQVMDEARDAEAGLVLVTDEVDEVLGASDWQSVARSDRHRIKQSRKYGVDWFWTAQFVDQVLKELRNITEEVELVRAYPVPTLQRFEQGKRPWLIRGQRFRPGALRELTAEPEKDRRLGSVWHRYRREHEGLYDTDAILIPPRPEALCSRHAREEKEGRCPLCHPERGPRGAIVREVAAAARVETPEAA